MDFAFAPLPLSQLPAHKEGYGHPRLNTKDVVLGPRQLWVRSHVTAQIDHINLVEFVGHITAEPVKSSAVDEAAIGNKGDDPVIVQPIRRPAKEPRVQVIDLGLLRRAQVDKGPFDQSVDLRIGAVLVVVVLILLVCVLEWVTNDH